MGQYLNSIPTNLIDRVDIVTGGNSAVYGSDAIAGVVNFVLKQNVDGLQMRAGTAIPGLGQGSNQYISGIVGKNFGEGRGNITVAGEYTHQDRLFGSDVPWLSTAKAFVGNDNNPSSRQRDLRRARPHLFLGCARHVLIASRS